MKLFFPFFRGFNIKKKLNLGYSETFNYEIILSFLKAGEEENEILKMNKTLYLK